VLRETREREREKSKEEREREERSPKITPEGEATAAAAAAAASFGLAATVTAPLVPPLGKRREAVEAQAERSGGPRRRGRSILLNRSTK